MYSLPEPEPLLLFIEQVIPVPPAPVYGYAALNTEGGERSFYYSYPHLGVELGAH